MNQSLYDAKKALKNSIDVNASSVDSQFIINLLTKKLTQNLLQAVPTNTSLQTH
jgi:hypothetical protein